MTYPGGKAGAGVYQTIINEMPRHERYVEPFVGGGAIFLRKRPAASSVLIDAEPNVAEAWRRAAGERPGVHVVGGDALRWLAAQSFGPETLIYADPPYVRSSRKSADAMYAVEMTDEQHVELLSLLKATRARVMLSGYANPLYDEALAGWRRMDFKAMTRRGPAIETLWMNYPASVERHELTYLGSNFRERERIKRKKDRWRRKLAALPALERAAIMEVLRDIASSEPATGSQRQDERCAIEATA